MFVGVVALSYGGNNGVPQLLQTYIELFTNLSHVVKPANTYFVTSLFYDLWRLKKIKIK